MGSVFVGLSRLSGFLLRHWFSWLETGVFYYLGCACRREERKISEPFSANFLNQPIGNETPVLRIELLQAPHGDFQNGVCLRDYLQRMNRDACRMAYGMIDGETIEEIQAYYRWSNAYTAYTYRILYNAIQEYLTI